MAYFQISKEENPCKLAYSVTVPQFQVGFYPIKDEFFIN